MKKIVFINRCYWPDSEATGQLLTELCEFLAPRWDVSAVVGQPNWETEKESFVRSGTQTRNGVEIHRLAHSTLPKGQRFARVRNLVSFTLAVRKWGRGKGRLEAGGLRLEAKAPSPPAPLPAGEGGKGKSAEIIVCETDPFLLPLVVGPLARRRKARIVYYLQDIYPDVAVAVGVTKNNFLIRMLRSRLRREYLLADAIVVLDEDMRDRLVGWGLPKERMRIVPNWMDCSAVKPIKVNNPFRIAHALNDRFVVMHSGNMGMTQRLDVLIDAMKRIEKSHVQAVAGNANSQEASTGKDATECRATLLLVGNGAKRSSLETQANGSTNVRFFDYQPREKLSESLSAADLHVVSMDQAITGCLAPSKLYGILASGSPVLAIVPKGNAVWQLVEKEQLGWTVEPGDANGIVHAILAAQAMTKDELMAMGQRGRVLAENSFDKKICCEAFEEVLGEVAS